jgi:phosphatidylglycerol---prolipoprotein diacylglyceryl transferase
VKLAAIAFPAIDPVALQVGPFAVRWYGLAYLAGFLGAYLVMRWLVGRWKINISDDDQLTIVLAAVVGVVLGGRLGYVLFYGDGYYWSRPAQIVAVWDGGMSFHGGLVGILVAAVVVAAAMRIPWLTLCDIGSVGAPVGIFFGRLANFVNQELWGRVTTLPWAVVFPGAGASPRHPSQLYEALLEGLVLFVVMIVMASQRHQLPRGVIFGVLLTLYGVFRVSVEFLREPDVQVGFLPGGLTMGQALSAPLIVGGIALAAWSMWRGLPEQGRPGVAETSR